MRTFQAFFSYSHHDALTNPQTIKVLSESLEREVNSKILNARFAIWKDTKNLRTGDRWDERIGEAVKSSDVLIVLITPKWLESEYCRKEFTIFEEYEPDVGDYIAPILVRSIDKQIPNLSEDQTTCYARLKQRQYVPMSSPNSLSGRSREKDAILSKLADDIEGMIERLRRLEEAQDVKIVVDLKRSRKTFPAFTAKAHNYDDVDFISSAEVTVEKTGQDGLKNVFAHVDFIPRMYIQSNSARLELAIRRAYLSIDAGKLNPIDRNEDWLGGSRGNAYYVKLKDSDASLNICIEPPDGRDHLRELALPPAPGENRFARVGSVNSSADYKDFTAKLTVSMRAESLYVFAANEQEKPAQNSLRKITAIINAMIAKEENSDKSAIERNIEVTEKR